MAPVVAVVKAVVAVVKVIAATKIGAALLYTAASTVVSRLIAKRAMSKATSGGDGGGRVQLPPASDNKLPVIYGRSFVSGPVVDAKISTDNKTMWYVIALAEHTDTTPGSGYTFGQIYYGGKLATVVGTTITALTTNTTPAQTDTRINGKVNVYLYSNGSNSGVNTALSAITIMSDVNIPVNERWNSTLYTASGQSADMTNTAFAIVKVDYNVDAGTTGLDSFQIEVTNSITQPGTAIKDYMLNERYGCGIPLDRIDTDSLTDLNSYSNQLITYTPVGGGSATQARYTVNGPLDTANNCLLNLQILVDSCDSWLQYSEIAGKWRVIMNKPYTGTLSNLYAVNDDNVIGGIQINPIDLNETYNEVEVGYPNTNIKDQTDYQILTLTNPSDAWYDPTLISPNEATNRLNISFPLVNNAVQAKYLGVRRLLQSREDLTISFNLDYSGIQIEAGDVIRVTHNVYGWTDKLFRVSSVSELVTDDNALSVSVVAFEYNGSIYNDNAIQDFVPAFNTGLSDPNVITAPGTPNVALNSDDTGQISSFRVTSAVPEQGSVLYMDINYGTTSNVQQHILYRTLQAAGGIPFTNSGNISGNANVNNLTVDINDIVAGTYYFSTTARNDFTGTVSNASSPFIWVGANINAANIVDANGVSSNGNLFTSNTAVPNLSINANVYLLSGTGQLANNTYITNVISTTQFTVTPVPLIALVNANIQVVRGGINGNAITPNTLPGNRVIANTMNGNVIIGNTLNGNVIISNTLNGNVIISNSVNGNVLISNTVNGNTIIANTINGNTIIANTVNGNTIIANTLNGNTIKANTINGNTIIANTMNGNVILANTLFGNSIIANSLNGNSIIADTLSGNSIKANTLFGNSIVANSIQGNRIIANTMNGNVILANTLFGNAIIANTLNGNTIKANTVNGNVILANTLFGNSIIADSVDGNVIKAGTLNGNTVIAGTLNGNTITAGTINGNSIIAGTINGNTITAGTLNGNTIIAGTINGNSIIAGTVNGNSIIAGTLNGNTITAGTINGNSIQAGTVNGNTIVAGTLNGNSIQAFSINGGVAFIAGTIQAQAIAANTITFENLAIGAVTQSKSTISDPIVEPIPWTNITGTWPNDTRCVVPAGGVTIIPQTNPQSSANTEYTEGSRIQISYSVKFFVEPTPNVGNVNANAYNLVEIWKSGATSVYDRGFNTIRHSYYNGNTTAGRPQTIHAYGSGAVDAFSSDGGNTWGIFAPNAANTTITGAVNINTGNTASDLQTVPVGYLQNNPAVYSLNGYVSTGIRTGNVGLGGQLTIDTNFLVSGGTYRASYNTVEMMPYTGGNGYITSPLNNERIAVGQNGLIFYDADATGSPNGTLENANVIKNLYDVFGGQPNGTSYTAIIAGQSGTILKSSRTIGSLGTWSAKSTYLLDSNGNSNLSSPLTSDLYSIASDNSVQSSTSKWVAVGQYGMIQVSVDNGETWKQVLSPNSEDYNAVRYGANKWIIAGDNGTLIYNQGNIQVANDWIQINTSNLNYSNGTNFGPITGNLTVARSLNTIDYSPYWDTFNVGGQAIILHFPSGNNVPRVANVYSPSESLNLTRMTYFGSYANVQQVSPAPAQEQQILNNQIFSGTILDTQYVQGQETTYYLVIGNMASRRVLAGQIFLQVQEIKR